MLKEIWLHAMNLCCNIFLGNLAILNELLHQHACAGALISIVRDVSVLGGDEKLVSLYSMFLNKG